MKKSILFLVAFLLIMSFPLFAQVAKIVATEGDVQVKLHIVDSWQKAKPDMYLQRQSEIKTASFSECTVAFDEELANILTIKENSHIKIEELKPGKVFLPRGRVFSLVDDLAKIKEFEIRTPTAITGVRGTGDSVESNDDGTTVKCFEGSVNVGGQDEQGGKTDDKDLKGGKGVGVGIGGIFGDLFNLTSGDFSQWFDFKRYMEFLRKNNQGPDQELGDSGNDMGDSFEDLKDEQRDDFKDQDFEELRSGGDSYSSPGGKDDFNPRDGDDDDDNERYREIGY